MKKILLFLLISVFLFNLISADKYFFNITGELQEFNESRFVINILDSQNNIVAVDSLEVIADRNITGSLSQTDDKTTMFLYIDDYNKEDRLLELTFIAEINESFVEESRIFYLEDKDKYSTKDIIWTIVSAAVLLFLVYFITSDIKQRLKGGAKENERRN